MTYPQLTFFCELESDELDQLFRSAQLFEHLKQLNAAISMGLVDLSAKRAEIVRRLNEEGIRVTAWLLLPEEQGYWFNAENLESARQFYEEFKVWTNEHSLKWCCVGIDIEPDIREIKGLANNRTALLPNLLKRLINQRQLLQAEVGYQRLVEEINADGYTIESYQLPVIEDERKIGSTLLRRMTGLVDIDVDLEVWMLYSSSFRPHGTGILGSYAPEAKAVGIGVTGGGIDLEIIDAAPLSWREFSRDLRLAWYWCDKLYIFSLEGCIENGYLSKLINFSWDKPIIVPEANIRKIDGWRAILRTGLWLSVHMWKIMFSLLGAVVFIKLIRDWMEPKQAISCED